MKVLFIALDWVSPTGKTNLRILKSLVDQGIECRVLSAEHCDDIAKDRISVCSTFPNRPSLVFESIGDFLGFDVSFISWAINAKRKARLITKTWLPDIVYARALPIATFQVGLSISSRLEKPLFIHFSDPVPPTPDWNNGFFYRRKKLRSVINPLKSATGISFVNMEMMHYQQTLVNFDILKRCFVSPNPIVFESMNSPTYFGKSPAKYIGLFLGSFYKSRSPELLFEAFEYLISRGLQLELQLVGTEKGKIEQYLRNSSISKSVKVLPRTNNVRHYLYQADLLIDVDSSYVPQVYTSGKLMEYLSVEKPILCITPEASPSRNLLCTCTKSVFFSHHNLVELVDKLEYLYSNRDSKFDFTDRALVLKRFEISNVTKELINRFRVHAK